MCYLLSLLTCGKDETPQPSDCRVGMFYSALGPRGLAPPKTYAPISPSHL